LDSTVVGVVHNIVLERIVGEPVEEVGDSRRIEGVVDLQLTNENVVHECHDHDLLLNLIFFDSCYIFFKYDIEI
jgi:hypothetical protein